jgi:Flp pilus assembly pilin Flp
MRSSLRQLARRFIVEESGQDLIEYGLLTAVVTLSSIVVFATIRDRMADWYVTWRDDFQDESKWIPPAPGS